MKKRPAHTELVYPDPRIGTIDLGQIGRNKHHVAGLLEIDVTPVIARIKALRAEGIRVTFFSWMVKAISEVIAENRYMHAQAGRRNHTVVFDDVDISVVVEREVDGTRVPIPLLIKKTNEKSAQMIHQEIQRAQVQQIRDEGDFVLADGSPPRRLMQLYYVLPQWMRLALLRHILRSPYRTKAMMGTVMITSVGTAGHLSGWFIPRAMHTLCFALGSVVKKPWVVENRIAVRDVLHLTLLFDHDVVDGVPAMRFASRLSSHIGETA